MLNENLIKSYVNLLTFKGELGLYRFIIGNGIIKSLKDADCELELLNLSDEFFSQYRRTGEDCHFIIGRILRRSAHTIYRQLLKINKEKKTSGRFLQIIK